MKKNKFNHVGRPTIQEVNNYNKKKTLKIIGIISSILIFVCSLFIYYNKDSVESNLLMGNFSSLKTVKFKPNKINENNINLFYYSNNSAFVWNLYKSAGFSTDYLNHGYKRLGIKVYSSDKKFLKTYLDGKIFFVNKKYAGQTFILKIYMQNKKNKRNVTKLVKLHIDESTMYNLTIKHMLNYSNSLVGNSFSQTKKVFSSYETNNYDGDWCSWFAWNIYHKYGFAKKKFMD